MDYVIFESSLSCKCSCVCGAAPSLAAACCLCQLPLHHYKASSGSAGKQKIFTKFWCCFGGWGWLFCSPFTIAFNCLCENIYHLPWTFPMCSVLVSAELRTLVPHTAHGSSYFGRLSLVLWRAAPSPPPPLPLPWQHQHHLAAHVATTRSSFARPAARHSAKLVLFYRQQSGDFTKF